MAARFPRGRARWMLGAGMIAAAIAVGGVFVVNALQVHDEGGTPVGVSGVRVEVAATADPSAAPTGSATSDARATDAVAEPGGATTAPTGAATVSDPTPIPVDDHGGQNGKSGGSGGGGSDD